MIQINLLPAEYRPKTPSKFTLPELPIKKSLFTALGVLFALQITASLFAGYEAFQLASVKNEIKRLEGQAAPIAKEKAEIRRIGERLTKTISMMDRKYYWSSLLNGLTQSVTKGVWLTGVALAELKPAEGDKKDDKTPLPLVLRLDGSVVGPGEETASIGKFLKELKNNPVFNELFSSIELSNMVQKKVRDFDVYDFSIYCTFKDQPPPPKEKSK